MGGGGLKLQYELQSPLSILPCTPCVKTGIYMAGSSHYQELRETTLPFIVVSHISIEKLLPLIQLAVIGYTEDGFLTKCWLTEDQLIRFAVSCEC